jgi:hypothetical protein
LTLTGRSLDWRILEGGSTEATKAEILILEMAIARSRASGLAGEETEARIRAAFSKAAREILRLEEHGGDRADVGLVLGEEEVDRACASARSRCATDRGKRGIETNLSRDAQRWIGQGRWRCSAAQSNLARRLWGLGR